MGGGDPSIWSRQIKATHDTFDDLGGYDAQYVAGVNWPIGSWRINSMSGGRYIAPGQEGVPKDFCVQYHERESITVEDYDKIANLGWNRFCEEYFPRTLGISLEQLDAAQKALLKVYVDDVRVWKERGVAVMTGALAVSCEMILSLGRTLPKFTLDVHRYPEKVKAALEAMVPDIVQNCIADTKASGIPSVVVSLERGSGSYYNLKIYEELFFPPLKKMVDAFTAAGLITVLHFDTNWTLNMPYMRDLPKGKCICELDSTTDIWKAKEILKGHMCIMGDVSASLLSLGTPEQVVTYCKKLIDLIGKDGGFILSTGCECPPDAKLENVQAMIDTGKNYYPHS